MQNKYFFEVNFILLRKKLIFRTFFLFFTASVRSRPPGPPAVPGVFSLFFYVHCFSPTLGVPRKLLFVMHSKFDLTSRRNIYFEYLWPLCNCLVQAACVHHPAPVMADGSEAGHYFHLLLAQAAMHSWPLFLPSSSLLFFSPSFAFDPLRGNSRG